MARRLRLLFVALLMAVTGVVVAGPAVAADDPPAVYEQALDLALLTQINQARAAAGSPPLSATHSVDVYALYTASGDWACGGGTNPYGFKMVPTYGINGERYLERISAEPAASADVDTVLASLLRDDALLDPRMKYVGLVSLSGLSNCPETLRTAVVVTDRVAWFGQVVSLVSRANGRFVTAENGGALPLVANRDTVGQWEQFDLLRVSATDVTLRSLANGQYVTAEAAGTRPLIANRSSAGAWETFAVVPTDTTTVALFSRADDRWVSADRAGQAPLIADRTAVGTWEQFELRGRGGDAFRADDMNGR